MLFPVDTTMIYHIPKALLLCWLLLGIALTLPGTGANKNRAGIEKHSTEKSKLEIPIIDLTPWMDTSPSSSSTTKTRTRQSPDSEGLSKEQREIVDRVRRACQGVGFVQILTDRRFVDPDVLEGAYKASRDFFDLPVSEKLLLRSTPPDYPYGYERSEVLSRGGKLLYSDHQDWCSNEEGWCQPQSQPQPQIPDTKETFSLGPPDENGSGMPPRKWTLSDNSSNNNNTAGFRAALERYYQTMEDLAGRVLLPILALALGESFDFFENKMDHHMSALRLLHYRPLHDEAYKNNNNTVPVRAGAHTDYGALTILATKQEGLQVLLPDAKTPVQHADTAAGDGTTSSTMNWYNVPVVEGAFVVNLGDLMQRWTNGKWLSTMHRVVTSEERYSMAYFVNINGDTLIEPLQHCWDGESETTTNNNVVPILTAREHLMAKHLAASTGISLEDFDNSAKDSRNANTIEME